MKPRHFALAPLLLPTLSPPSVAAESDSKLFDTSYQVYQEDNNRMGITSYYLRQSIDIDADTTFRFQYLRDAIAGYSPTGFLPGYEDQGLNFLDKVTDVRTAVLGALSRQFGDHRAELEASSSDESDYKSEGVALSDAWSLNQKNTTLAFGVNYLSDKVKVSGIQAQGKRSLDFFTGITQVLDKNTVISANLTLGNVNGYLNDPYKGLQRSETYSYDDGTGNIVVVPYVTGYPENRPNRRFREVLQLEGTHLFDPLNGALDAVYRLSNDDFGVFSQCIQVEWRQAIGDKFAVIPFFRYYRQSEANFYMQTLEGVAINSPDINYPNATAPYYSADYRLSALDSVSVGLRLHYQFNDTFSGSVSYERYQMGGLGGNPAPTAAYPSASIWDFSLSAKF